MSKVNLFKLTCKALTELNSEELEIIAALANSLYAPRGLGIMEPTNEHNPTAQEFMRGIAAAGPAPRSESDIKAEKMDKTVSALAQGKVFHEKRAADLKKKRKTKPRRQQKHTGMAGKVWEAMQQATRKLASVELSEILGLTKQQVATSLTALTNAHPSILTREWVKGGWDEKKQQPIPGYYLYQYIGKKGGG